jgi:hypothetical protein
MLCSVVHPITKRSFVFSEPFQLQGFSFQLLLAHLWSSYCTYDPHLERSPKSFTVKEETCPEKRGKQDGQSGVQDEQVVVLRAKRGGPVAE